ncbi:MAG: hypothetical protein CVV44_20365 [Spirochaetae bacterium HGW-Spirochaetae-1]|jgi:hypothetical protein|nr:MAG: hypothetical protein CVV44_20365 [Spirochaetae bacterium HGW-Spirochaetae-1]
MQTIKIGGVDREIILRHRQVNRFKRQYNRIYSYRFNKLVNDTYPDKKVLKGMSQEEMTELVKKNAEIFNRASFSIPDWFWYKTVYRSLVKRGLWPVRRPYRSWREMAQDIRKDEYFAIVHFVASEILDLNVPVVNVDKKKEI